MAERKYKLTVTLSEKDYARLNKLKKATGLTTQAYFLKLFHDIQPKELPSQDYYDVLKELRQINLNLNQIALKISESGAIDVKAYWENINRLQQLYNLFKC